MGLDLACGDGRLTGQLLKATGWHGPLVGLDIDKAETDAAEVTGHYERVVTAPAEQMPEADATFDWVFSNSALEHMPSLDGVLSEVSRVLRPGGLFIFTVPSPDFHHCLRGPLRGAREPYLRMIDRRCAHVNYLDEAGWRQRLAVVGLEMREATPYLSGPETRRWETIARLTSGVLYTLTRGRRQPIEIQRSLGMRRRGRRLPVSLARALATLLASRVGEPDGCWSCLYISAEKRVPQTA